MSNKYDFASVEPKWQKYWEEHGSFRAKEDHTKPKFYALVEFPYPSGHGMHVGHIKAYSGLEVVSRKRRMQGSLCPAFFCPFYSFTLILQNLAFLFYARAVSCLA